MDRNKMTVKLKERFESGEIIEQKCWQYIKEVNGSDPEMLDLVAVTDCRRDYTYRQMYAIWEDYARVFSALGMTESGSFRVGMEGSMCAETVFAFFGLNMTGASVSMIQLFDENTLEKLEKIIRQDRISDLILTDLEIDPCMLRRLLKDKDRLGLNNVIVIHVPVEGEFAFMAEELRSRINYRKLKEVPGAVFMDDLLREYKDHDIYYAEKPCDDAAVVVHTSGTTEGVPKPVPFSDRGINETLRRHSLCGKTAPSKDRMTAVKLLSMSVASSFIGMMTPFANGGRLVAISTIDPFVRLYPVAEYYRVTNLVLFSAFLEFNMMLPLRPDLSSVETVMLVGAYTSADMVGKCREFMRECGSDANVLVGYGLAEAGVGLTLTDPDTQDDSVGRLLPGIKAKLWDEDEEYFHDIDGKEHTGVLFVSTPSLSCGRLDDDILFELEDIDGEKYLNTYDLFRVTEEGTLYCLGRMNKFFLGSDGVRFEAGLVERAVSAQDGIKGCALVPEFNKLIHDTLPVLYVETERAGIGGYRIIKKALESAYIGGGLIEKTALPVKCVITGDIPRNATGKVDAHRITEGRVSGFAYEVKGAYENGELKEIELEPAGAASEGRACDFLMM